jgi:hypothetical protein
MCLNTNLYLKAASVGGRKNSVVWLISCRKKQGGGCFFHITGFGCDFLQKFPQENPDKFLQESQWKFFVGKTPKIAL